jgi:hypothetical protein
MSLSTHNDLDRSAGAIQAEETLRLIASLPAPEGIEERVKAGVRTSDRQASVVSWPLPKKANWTQVSGMRAAAAAAIVFVVAGGGWGVYSHIRVAPVPTAIAAPQRIEVGAGWGGTGMSAAAARRTPKTLDGPKVALPANTKQGTDEGKAKLPSHGHRARSSAGSGADKSRSSLATER